MRKLTDFPIECREEIGRITRMRVALKDNAQFDENGYINSDGKFVPFILPIEEARKLPWSQVKAFWGGFVF